MLVTVNIKMTFTFKHPKYYKELRKRNKALRSCDAYSKENSNYTERQQSDQAISCAIGRRPSSGRAPGPGLKQQAASDKLQAASDKPTEPQASSGKLQASSNKLQAPSHKRQAP